MQEIFEALKIEPAQIISNVIGFGILWWLIRKYAWRPILDFMDERREEIAGNFRKIDQERADLAGLRDEYQGHLDRIDDEASRRINDAIRKGEDAARQIEANARSKAQSIIEKSHADTERIIEQARLDLKNYVVDMGVEAGKKAAMEVLDESTHRRLVERFVEELGHVR